jgi:cytochrome c oxidase cbb3-type subunit III
LKPSRDELLNHDADGIREFDNALPRWWLYGFYFTIAFAAAYLVNYHVLPRPLVGYPTVAAEYAADVERAAGTPSNRPVVASGAVFALEDRESLEKGRAIFEGSDNTCFACHRADLGGLVGPNLTDEYWMHGCSAADLVNDIKHGFAQKGMLPFGTGKVLTEDQLLTVVSYVLSKQGSKPTNPKAIDPAREKACG